MIRGILVPRARGRPGQTDCGSADGHQHLREDIAREFLVIGGPGVDGIDWGYRKGHSGIWAHYPIDDEFVLLAGSASELREGYFSGRIKV